MNTGRRMSRTLPPAAGLAMLAACADGTAPPGPPALLEISAQPAVATAGTPFPTVLSVVVRDSAGRLVTASPVTVRVSLTAGSGTAGAHLRGTGARATIDGVADFPDLSIDSAGTGFTLTATAPGLGAATAAPVVVHAGPPSRLAIAAAPASADVDAVLAVPVLVAVQDSLGNTVPGATNPVTMTVVSVNGSAALTLGGTTTKAAAAGWATFTDLFVDRPGGVRLVASAAGLEDGASPAIPVKLVGVSLTAGSEHACVLSPRGAAWCWGNDYYGQLGDGIDVTNPARLSVSRAPTLVAGPRFVALKAGASNACGVAVGGAAWCWGLHHPFVAGSTAVTSTPFLVGGTALARAAAGLHACALDGSGQAFCWGDNAWGELGIGVINAGSASLLPVTGGRTFVELDVSNVMSCGVTATGTGYCWGYNNSGFLGDGSYTVVPVPAPKALAGGLAFRSISPGSTSACGVTTAGKAYCWGGNQWGQLGTGTTDSSAAPVAVAGGLSFTVVSTGYSHACGVTTTGAGYCWGSSLRGELGDGSGTESHQPVAVAGGLSFATIAAGTRFSCGLTTTGAAYCWGDNAYGQLGSAGAAVGVPVRVPKF